MSSKVIPIIKYVILLAVAIALLALAFRGIRIETVWMGMMKAKPSWILLSLVLGLMAFWSRSVRWNILIEPLGFKPSIRKTMYALMIGYLANLALPRLGEVTRCGTLSKSESIPFSSLLGTVVVERVIDLISLFICLLLTATFEYKRLGEFLTNNILQPIGDKLEGLMSSPGMILILVAFVCLILFLLIFFVKRSRDKEGESKVLRIARELLNGLKSIGKLHKPGAFIFHSIFIWLLYFLGTYVCFFALPGTSNLDLSAALFMLVVGGLGMSAPVQGGIGVYHFLVSQGLLLYSLTIEDGLTFATMMHTLSFLSVVVLGVASLILLFLENKKKIIVNTDPPE